MQTDTWKAALRASCASTSVRFSLEEGGAPVPQDKDLRLNHATVSDSVCRNCSIVHIITKKLYKEFIHGLSDLFHEKILCLKLLITQNKH